MNPNEIHCHDCGALIGEIRDGALVRPMDTKADHVPTGEFKELVKDGWVMSPVVSGKVACRHCGLLHQVSRSGNELGTVTVQPGYRVPFTTKRRAEIEASRRRRRP